MFNLKRTLATTVAIAALGAPATASAMPNLESGSAPGTAVIGVEASRGFQWDDAGIGAAGMLAVVVGGAAAGSVLVRRRRVNT
jgi:hypothetical protein